MQPSHAPPVHLLQLLAQDLQPQAQDLQPQAQVMQPSIEGFRDDRIIRRTDADRHAWKQALHDGRIIGGATGRPYRAIRNTYERNGCLGACRRGCLHARRDARLPVFATFH